jgi:hypothetical protein
VNDATILIRDMVGDAAEHVATKVNPNDEQLAQIDKPADDNTWHDTPNLTDIKSQIKSAVDKNTPFSKKAAKNAQANAASQDDPQAAAQAGTSTLRQHADENIPDEQKDKAHITKEKTKSYLVKKMPKERREQTIWRLKKLVVEIQGHPDCK